MDGAIRAIVSSMSKKWRFQVLTSLLLLAAAIACGRTQPEDRPTSSTTSTNAPAPALTSTGGSAPTSVDTTAVRNMVREAGRLPSLSFAPFQPYKVFPLVSTARPAGLPAQLGFVVGAGAGACDETYELADTPRQLPVERPAITVVDDPTALGEFLAIFCLFAGDNPSGIIQVTLNDGRKVSTDIRAEDQSRGLGEYLEVEYHPSPGDTVGVHSVLFRASSGAEARTNFQLAPPKAPSLRLLPSRPSAPGGELEIEIGLFGLRPLSDVDVHVFASVEGEDALNRGPYFGTYIVTTDAKGSAGASFRTAVPIRQRAYYFTAESAEVLTQANSEDISGGTPLGAAAFVLPTGSVSEFPG